MTIFTLTYEQMLAVASLQHMASKDDVTPVLTGIELHVTPTTLTATATDRYVVGQLITQLQQGLENDVPEEGVKILLPRADVAQVARMRSEIQLTFDAPADARQSVSVTASAVRDHRSLTFPSIYGNFPPVDRLFYDDPTEDIPSGIAFNMGLLARVTKLLLPGEKSTTTAVLSPWVLKYQTMTSVQNKKMSPLMAERGNGRDRFRVLVQPNVSLR